MSMELLKGMASALALAIATTCVIIFQYPSVYEDALALIRGEDYIFYYPQIFPMLFLFPVVVLVDLFFIISLFLMPVRYKVRDTVKMVVEKLAIPFVLYGGSAIVLGLLVSLVVSIYPLSTHYYKCDSTSVISPESHYARTKEICKERARLRALEWESPGTAEQAAD